MSKRDKAYEAWWKKRRKSIVPSALGVAALATRQAWDAAWDYRDANGPEEVDARERPLEDDIWVKYMARGVKRLRRFVYRIGTGNKDRVVFEEKTGSENWKRGQVKFKSWVAWTQTASLMERGRAL